MNNIELKIVDQDNISHMPIVNQVDNHIPIVDDIDTAVSPEQEQWKIFGYSVPKQEVVFFAQIIAIYIVIVISLINVSLQNTPSELWLSLLSASLGYLLPSPSLKRETIIVQHSSS